MSRGVSCASIVMILALLWGPVRAEPIPADQPVVAYYDADEKLRELTWAKAWVMSPSLLESASTRIKLTAIKLGHTDERLAADWAASALTQVGRMIELFRDDLKKLSLDAFEDRDDLDAVRRQVRYAVSYNKQNMVKQRTLEELLRFLSLYSDPAPTDE
ncbi:hypothetical protein ACFL2T_00895 [Elusimicrobiota bacterium]